MDPVKDLSPRQITILKAIIEEYIATAEPVGSETLDKKYNLGVSPATIRNEMMKLTELKMLNQEQLDRVHNLFNKVGYSTSLPSQLTLPQMLATMNNDKKVFNNKINFVVLDGIGSGVVRDDVAPDMIEGVVKKYFKG